MRDRLSSSLIGGENIMTKRCVSLLVVLMAAVSGCTQLSPELQVVHDAAEALGGVEAVRGATTMVIEGSGSNYRLGQNRTPDAPLPTSEVESYTLEVDLQNHRSRVEVVSANFAGNLGTAVRALDGSVAFDVGGNGNARRVGSSAASERRAEYYHHPLTLLQAALAEDEAMAATVSDLRQESGQTAVDITTADGSQLTLHLDAQTRLPVMIESRSYNTNLGDVTIATTFADYTDAGGFMLPQERSQTIDDLPSSELRVTHVVNPEIGDLAAPAEVASAGEPGAPSANVTVEELASGVWFLAGQSHHSVLVDFPEYTVLVEAPQNDTRTLAVIAQARALVPDKPLRYLLATHHHFDHSGGVRAAVAEGLTVITHETNRELFEELVARPHTTVADHLAQNPASLMLDTVTGTEPYQLGGGNRVMQIYRVGDNPHSDGMLVAYLPREQILIQADMYIPGVGGPFATTAALLLQSIQDRGLRVSRLVPIHGEVVPLSQLEEAVEAAAN